jgi:hypothetical protein
VSPIEISFTLLAWANTSPDAHNAAACARPRKECAGKFFIFVKWITKSCQTELTIDCKNVLGCALKLNPKYIHIAHKDI